MTRTELQSRLPTVVDALVASVVHEPRMRHLNRVHLPSRDEIVACVGLLRQLLFPGYFGKPGLTSANVTYRVGEIVTDVADRLYEQVRHCLRYRRGVPDDAAAGDCGDCDDHAAQIVSTFLDRIPVVRETLSDDVQAAFDSDPAAQSTDETVFSYPGLYAISVQRLAHEFYSLDVPLLPRIMTEHAHGETGIDIHPGATLGRRLFIDHGTGVVIGETCTIGRNVKIYQGVTLGALAPDFGQALRGTKRHPCRPRTGSASSPRSSSTASGAAATGRRRPRRTSSSTSRSDADGPTLAARRPPRRIQAWRGDNGRRCAHATPGAPDGPPARGGPWHPV